MDIKHEILSFDSTNGSIEVKYTTDAYVDGLIYNIDLPITGGNYPTPEEIESLVIMYRPIGQIERLGLLKTVSVPNYLMAIKRPEYVPEPDPVNPTIYGVDPLPSA